MLFAAFSAQAQSDDFDFDPAITQQEFETFSRLVAQSIYATPVEPARARGLLGFDIGLAATAVPIDTNASYWQRAVENDFTVSDHLAVPRLIVSKGLSVATISAQIAKVPDSDVQVWGASLDVPIISGGIVAPTLSVRGAWSQIRGIEELDLKTYGAELFLSKAFGPITPYIGAGVTRSDSEGNIDLPNANTIVLRDESQSDRLTVGVRISLLLPKIVVEATQGEERSYAAKVAFGL